MIKLEKTQVVGLEPAIRGMRNPMNSWEKSDSLTCPLANVDLYHKYEYCKSCPAAPSDVDNIICSSYDSCDYTAGKNDRKLMMSLAKSGTDHAKFRRMIVVYVDITAPLYWWKEFDTYKIGTVANSCSTMHKIADKEFTLEDFSVEHLIFEADIDDEEYQDAEVQFGMDGWRKVNDKYCGLEDSDFCEFNQFPGEALKYTIDFLNRARDLYLKTKDKRYWWQMIQLLPSSYNQKRTVMLSYEVLANIYKSRKNHKLDEWRELCDWIKDLPVSEVITLEAEGGSENEK